MNIERIILEMLDRIKILEEKVEMLETAKSTASLPCTPERRQGSNFTQAVREYIVKCKLEAKEKGLAEITLLCNDIQKAFKVTGRPASVCTAMYDCMKPKDEIVFAPPKGKSTTLKIKYYLD